MIPACEHVVGAQSGAWPHSQTQEPATLQSQKGEEALFDDVEDSGQEEGEGQEDEQLVGQLPAVVLGDELPPQLDGARHGFKFLIGIQDSPGRVD